MFLWFFELLISFVFLSILLTYRIIEVNPLLNKLIDITDDLVIIKVVIFYENLSSIFFNTVEIVTTPRRHPDFLQPLRCPPTAAPEDFDKRSGIVELFTIFAE